MATVARESSNLKPDVTRFLELGRKIKQLEEERRDLGAVLLAHLDAEGLERWEDADAMVFVVEQAGRETADVAALKAAGLDEYVRRGAASRYLTARWK